MTINLQKPKTCSSGQLSQGYFVFALVLQLQALVLKTHPYCIHGSSGIKYLKLQSSIYGHYGPEDIKTG